MANQLLTPQIVRRETDRAADNQGCQKISDQVTLVSVATGGQTGEADGVRQTAVFG